MITRGDLDERAREWGLRDDTVEKDFVLGWTLWGIGSDEKLSNTWVFKGGTCLKKCYIETFRFSEDLDFTVMPGGPITPEEVTPILQAMLVRVATKSGIDFSIAPLQYKMRPTGRSAEGKIYYRGPRGAPQAARIKLDLNADEKVARPTVLRAISHTYPDKLPEPGVVRCYGFEEVFAEKIRAMGERSRPRDLYDIVNLFRRPDLRAHPELIREVLVEKCLSKGIAVPTLATVHGSEFRGELESEWGNMLAHQLPQLPPFQQFWDELPALFSWLEGGAAPAEPAAYPAQQGDEAGWAPPATVWLWGAGPPIESIRFAAANRLCVELGYLNSLRIIEPYSLRRTRDGNMILYAVKADTGDIRGYRIDRIQSIKVTQRTFTPRYAVELTSGGPLHAPAVTRTQMSSLGRPIYRRPSSGPTFVIECSTCGKKFRRTQRGTALNLHKNPDGYTCYGRNGYLIDTIY